MQAAQMDLDFDISQYPLRIPEIEIEADLDFLLLQLPPRYMPLMPNGLAYVDLTLRNTGVKVQTIDINILMYHRYHARRIMAEDGKAPVLPSGFELTPDPWTPTGVDDFSKPEVVDYFWPLCQQAIDQIKVLKPKAVGLTVDGTNLSMCNRFVEALRKESPDTLVVVGGYLFLRDLGGDPRFEDFDYMVVMEAEESLPPLAEAIARGERPGDLPGVVSRFDSPDRGKIQPILKNDITSVGYPTYEWTDLALYHASNGHFLVPISSSRGCSWSRCRFCSECFTHRNRDPESVGEEIQYFVQRGVKYFHFNESIVGGDPANLHDICTEVLKRNLPEHYFWGQIHVHKNHTVDYFKHIKAAGFHSLRFGIDGWSENVVRRQRKGYTMDMVKENLKNAHEAGIAADVNVLLGVPGETEEDVDETIENLAAVRPWIRSVGSYNTLNLTQESEYWRNPELYGIEFRGDKEQIYAENRHYIPGHLWYSVGPYIDEEVKAKRAERVNEAIIELGLRVGDFSKKVLKHKRAELAGVSASAAE